MTSARCATYFWTRGFAARFPSVASFAGSIRLFSLAAYRSSAGHAKSKHTPNNPKNSSHPPTKP
jgi:hypothetical protein